MEYWKLTKTLPNKVNQDVINEFLLNLKLQNRSDVTIKRYRIFLEHFFAHQEIEFSKLSPEVIIQWFRTHQAHVKESSFRVRLNIISSFFTFCVQEEYLTHSPIKRRWFPRLPQPVPKYIGKEEIAKIRRESEMVPLRSQCLVEFLLTSGCRVGETSRLKREEVDFENRTARVVGKGKKIRYVHFTEKCSILLQKYLEIAPKSVYLFSTSTGKNMNIETIERIIRDLGENANIGTSLYPHRFRHTFATDLLSKGAELSFIQEELGHSDISTTQIYAKLPMTEIVSLYRKYMG